MRQEQRVVLRLTLCQTLFQTGGVLLTTVGGLAGVMLAPSPLLATLPIATVSVGMAISIFPSSLLMGAIGRRRGFIVGALAGAAGGSVAVTAMVLQNFWLLCLGTGMVGLYHGCAQFYRFAAAEAASADFKSRALSLVLTGGVVAAVVGPNLGAAAQDLIPAGLYAGSYAVVVVLSLAAVAVLATTPFPPQVRAAAGTVDRGAARPMREIARQPSFVLAVAGASVGYFIMVMVMTATPLSMHAHHHAVAAAALVIQWHVLGMYVPSFFTGWLVRKLGVLRLMLSGVAVLLVHVAVALSGFAVLQYVSALTLLGVGWNFLYVGGSTLLTETYRPAEASKVQAVNDFTVMAVTATASLSAGALEESIGWHGLGFLAIAPLLAVGAGILLTTRTRRRAGPAPQLGAEPADAF